jgi:hypothetical protein
MEPGPRKRVPGSELLRDSIPALSPKSKAKYPVGEPDTSEKHIWSWWNNAAEAPQTVRAKVTLNAFWPGNNKAYSIIALTNSGAIIHVRDAASFMAEFQQMNTFETGRFKFYGQATLPPQDCVIKFTYADMSTDAYPRMMQARESFREFETMRRLSTARPIGIRDKIFDISAHVPKAFMGGYDRKTQTFFVVMTRSLGRTIDTMTSRGRNKTVSPLAAVVVERAVLSLFLNNTVHTDLHPGNIMVDETDPKNPRVTIIDFERALRMPEEFGVATAKQIQACDAETVKNVWRMWRGDIASRLGKRAQYTEFFQNSNGMKTVFALSSSHDIREIRENVWLPACPRPPRQREPSPPAKKQRLGPLNFLGKSSK